MEEAGVKGGSCQNEGRQRIGVWNPEDRHRDVKKIVSGQMLGCLNLIIWHFNQFQTSLLPSSLHWIYRGRSNSSEGAMTLVTNICPTRHFYFCLLLRTWLMKTPISSLGGDLPIIAFDSAQILSLLVSLSWSHSNPNCPKWGTFLQGLPAFDSP